MKNILLNLRNIWLIDDIMHFAAIICLFTAMWFIPVMITANLVTSGTTIYYRSKREETTEDLADNNMSDDPEGDRLHESDFIDTVYVGLPPCQTRFIQEDTSSWNSYNLACVGDTVTGTIYNILTH